MANPIDTGWQQPNVIVTPEGAKGVVQMASAVEGTPCYLCRKWHKDTRKLEQFIRTRGLTPDAEGNYEMRTPDLPDRQSIKIHLPDWGFCLTLAMPTHMQAGKNCPHWELSQTREDLKGKIR